ncbi:MAG: hypothetical protein HY716_04025 [Planctomycetes bacterium]|nr:hypothetical protein [Planctomycetota bacterium]
MIGTTKTRFSYGDIQRALADARGRPMTRSVLDRILRDYARELPEPETVGGARLWKVEDLEAFREVVRRDQECQR